MTQTRIRMLKICDDYQAINGRRPTAREIATEYGCTPTRVRQVLTSDELGAGPASWARVPKAEWAAAMQRLVSLESVLAKHGVADADELDRMLMDRSCGS